MRSPPASAGFDPFELEVPWRRTDDAEHPYRAELDGHTLVIRVNDWPDDETVYTLIEDGEEYDFNDWPECWRRP